LSARARAAKRRQAAVAAERDFQAARLGAAIRSVLIGPKSGFSGYLNEIESRPGGGRAAIGLGGVFGAALLLLWLKTNAVVEIGKTACTFQWTYLAGALVIGALLGVVAILLWGVLGPLVARRLDGGGAPSRFRLVWGAAAIPQVAMLVLLLPLDLLLVGSAAYRTVDIDGAAATAWRAMSLAFAVALTLWSLWVLFRGAQSAGGVSGPRSLWMIGVALLCLALPVLPTIIATAGKAASCT
jgi:hypothetical protein